MPIRMRIRGPGWTEQITAEDDWTVQALLDCINKKMGITEFALKYGFPPAALDLEARGTPLSSLKLNGETLTLVPAEPPSDLPAAPPGGSSGSAVPAAPASGAPAAAAETPDFKPKSVEPDELSIRWPERDGYISKESFTRHPLPGALTTRVPPPSAARDARR